MLENIKNETSEDMKKNNNNLTDDELNLSKTQVIPAIKNSASRQSANSKDILADGEFDESFENVLDDDLDDNLNGYLDDDLDDYLDDDLEDDLDEDDYDDDLDDYENKRRDRNKTSKVSTTKVRKSDKKNTLMIMLVMLGVLTVILVIAVAAFFISKSTKKGYNYNYNEGIKAYKDKNYSVAIEYLDKATSLPEGEKNLNLKYKLYECYYNCNEYDNAEEVLLDILTYDDNYSLAVKSLASLYFEQNDGKKLTELIRKYEDTSCESYIEEYMIASPTASVEPGTYGKEISVELKAGASASKLKLYYTLDNSEPSENNGVLYSGNSQIVFDDAGKYTIKAICINDMGICSNIATFEYEINFAAPDAPDVTPSSGVYTSDDIIKITNIPEGGAAYYTLDGSTPTENSELYTDDGIPMPEGNTVVSFIIISKNGLKSSVTRKNYSVATTKTYTYDEALKVLKTKLVQDKLLSNDETKDENGNKVTFVYHTKTTIDNTEMYCIRVDEIKGSLTSVKAYYGVAVKGGQLYKVSETDGTYSAKPYESNNSSEEIKETQTGSN